MDSAALVEVVSSNRGVLDNLDSGRLSWLFVVLNTAQRKCTNVHRGGNTDVSAILRSNAPPGMAILRCVMNSVLKTQLIRGSGCCGEPMPNENQSSFNVDVLTYLIEPRGMVVSGDMEGCSLIMVVTTMNTALPVCSFVRPLASVTTVETYKD